jgi:hypothetical protein
MSDPAVVSSASTENRPDPALRVRPRVWIGIVIWLAYIVIVFTVQQLSGVPYTKFGDNGSTLFRGAGISLIVGTILLAITTSLLGWWRPALFDTLKSPHRWPIVAPIVMAALALLNLAITDWSSFDLPFFGASIVLLLVGFTEEITTRGLLLVALRSRLSEGWVYLLSTLAFALMHFANAFSGQAFLPTSQQVVLAFLGGTIFYIFRRTTGSLIWAMALHALWDFSSFAVSHGHISPFAGFTTILYGLTGVFAVIAVRWTLPRAGSEQVA